MSNAKRRNSRDIPYWCWEGTLQDGKGFHLIRGLIYARHTAWMTETHNPSKFIASTLELLHHINLSEQEHQNRKRLDQIFHVTIALRVEGMQVK